MLHLAPRVRQPYRRYRSGDGGCIWRLIGFLRLALEVRRGRRELLSMDDRALKDIGLSRREVYEAQRSFWDIPMGRLRL
jgi:uncharacterized protein YjiS (DUF1127 family)